MKRILSALFALVIAGALQAQVENPGTAAKNGATDHANNDINNSINNGLNKTEGAIKVLLRKKRKTPRQPSLPRQPNPPSLPNLLLRPVPRPPPIAPSPARASQSTKITISYR